MEQRRLRIIYYMKNFNDFEMTFIEWNIEGYIICDASCPCMDVPLSMEKKILPNSGVKIKFCIRPDQHLFCAFQVISTLSII